MFNLPRGKKEIKSNNVIILFLICLKKKKKDEDGVGWKLEKQRCVTGLSSALLQVQCLTFPLTNSDGGGSNSHLLSTCCVPRTVIRSLCEIPHLFYQLLLLGLQIKIFQNICSKTQYNHYFSLIRNIISSLILYKYKIQFYS